MPLPAILAAIGRVGAQAFASGAARTAASGAASTASAAPVRQAGAVLTNVLGNAKNYTAALRGGAQAAAGPMPVAASPAPAAAPKANWPARTAGGGPGFSNSIGSPPPPGSSQAAAGPVNRPTPRGATPPGGQPPPKPPGAWERAANYAKAQAREYLVKRGLTSPAPPPKTVADDTKGMSLDQRYQRLAGSGNLLNSASLVGPKGQLPSMADTVAASERAEQRQREESAAKKEEGDKAGFEGIKQTAMKAAGMGSLAGLLLSIPKLTMQIEAWGEGLMESRRDLARFDGSIANAFARLDRQNLQMTARRAQATSGSTTTLGDSLGKLKREVEPMITAAATTANLLGTVALEVTRGVSFIVKLAPAFALWMRVMKIYERLSSKGSVGPQFAAFVEKASRGDFHSPGNKTPGEGKK